MSTAAQSVLEVRDLRTEFVTGQGAVAAVDGVSFTVAEGQTVALLGESGCGKTVTALSLMRLVPSPPGRTTGGSVVLFHPSSGERIDLLAVSEKRMRSIRGGRMAMIFQDPMASLNPVFTLGAQIGEAVTLHQRRSRRSARGAVEHLLERVGIPEPARRANDYPHQWSGGMQQRALIAMALACRPILLIADEPTSALDVTTQAQILGLLRRIQDETGMSLLIISHDLGVVANLADRVYVMYAGRIVEHGSVQTILARPAHPYTQALLECTPRLQGGPQRLRVIPGQAPDPANYPSGCRFHPRCSLTAAILRDSDRPALPADRGDQEVNVLATCQVGRDAEPGGPRLREIAPDRWAGCWEL